MEIREVVTVSDARSHLSRLLADLSEAGPEADPVLIGAHRKPQGVLLSVEAYETLLGHQERRAALRSASGSLAAEGLRASPAADHDAQAYIEGEISAEEMVARAVARHTANEEQTAG